MMIHMYAHSPSAPSLEPRDFLATFDLNRANIRDIRIYHEHGGLLINIELKIRAHSFPICKTSTTKVKRL